MTSIISPTLAATKLASTAQANLAQASQVLRQPKPWPARTGEATIGIPQPQSLHAANLAAAAIADIDRALALAPQLRSGTVMAFTNARSEAMLGVSNLRPSHGELPIGPIGPREVALQFDAASLWLGLAKNLIALGNGTLHAPIDLPTPPNMPPVTTMPIKDGPIGPIDLPIGPIPPITIQLPDPSSPIQ